MPDTADFLLTFHNTSTAMRAEKCSKARDMRAKLRPVPRELSSSCGLALEVNEVVLCDLKEVLNNNNIDLEGLYFCRDDEFVELDF